MDNKLETEVLLRLDVLIRLLLQSEPADDTPAISASIRRLEGLGLSPSEISRVIGKPLNYVTATLSAKKPPKK